MRRLILLAVLASGVAWGADHVCTLNNAAGSACASKTCTASAIAADSTHANFTGAGCTGNGYTPWTNSDNVVLPTGYTFTDDVGGSYGNFRQPVYSYVSSLYVNPGSTSGCTNPTITVGAGNILNGYSAGGTVTVVGGVITAANLNFPRPWYTATATAPVVTVSGGGCTFPGYSATTAIVPVWVQGNGVPALKINQGASFILAAKATFRGDINYNPLATGTVNITLNAGGGIIWDSSGHAALSDGTYPRYGLPQVNAGYTTTLNFTANGTSASHVTITSNSAGTNGDWLNPKGCNVITYNVAATYTDFSNLGSSIDSVIESNAGSNCYQTYTKWNVTHSTFNGVGMLGYYNTSGADTLVHQYNLHTNTLSLGGDFGWITNTTALSTGTRNISNNVFSGNFNCLTAGSTSGEGQIMGVTVAGNYFADSGCPLDQTASTLTGSLSYNLLRHYLYPAIWPIPHSALTYTGNYWLFPGPIYNPHLVSNGGQTGNVVWSNNVIDLQEDQTGGDTTYFFSSPPGSGPYAVSFLNNIVLRTKQGHGQGWMALSDTAIFGLNRPLTANHNVHWGRNTSGVGPGGGNYQGLILIDHGGTTSQAVSSLKSNIEVGLGGGYSAFKFSSVQFNNATTAATADMCTPSTCDYNAGYLLTYGNNCGGTQSTTCPNAGRGYDSKFATTPGPHDPDYVLGLTASNGLNPQFADPTRNLATWDTAYLHKTASTGPWSGSGVSYIPGQTASTPSTPGIAGQGCTTAYHIDKDCDRYGVGMSPNDPSPLLGPDADDNDAAVHTAAQLISKWGSLTAGLAHLGYTPLRQWFIATTGNDTTCAVNNASFPCATFAHVAASIQAGDAVLWRAGTYSEGIDATTPDVNGTSANPVILMAYPGELVIEDNTLQDNLNMYGISYITVDGLRFTNSATGAGYGIVAGGGFGGTYTSYGITIRNVEIYKQYTDAMIFNGMYNYLIEQSVFRDSMTEHSLYMGTENIPAVNVTVRHNLMYRSASNGFHFNGRVTNLVLDSNVVHSVEGAGFALQNGVSHSFITNNLVFEAETQALQFNDYWNSDCPSGPICPYDQNYNTIENNTFWSGTTDWYGNNAATAMPIGIFHTAGFPSTPVGDLGHNTYRNNILQTMGDVNYPAIVYEQGTGYLAQADTALASDTWTDNIIIGNSNTAVVSDGQTPGSGGYGYKSYTCAQFATLSTVSGCINAAPKFSATGAWNTPWLFNFTLQAGSPAIGGGTSVSQPAYDIGGALRTVPPDIGAYQYNVGSQPGVYGGATINYRVTAAHTSSTINQPDLTLTSANGSIVSLVVSSSTLETWTTNLPHGLSVGQLVYVWGPPGDNTPLKTVTGVTTYTFTTANQGYTCSYPCTVTTGLSAQLWRNWWEYASDYDLRTAIGNGTTYTDGSINCVTCLPVQAVVNWITAGQAVMNPALWLAGHDGQDVGAASLAPAQHMRFARRVP